MFWLTSPLRIGKGLHDDGLADDDLAKSTAAAVGLLLLSAELEELDLCCSNRSIRISMRSIALLSRLRLFLLRFRPCWK